jgi:hypothetical protein
MFLPSLCLAISLITIAHHASSTPADIIHLKDHFIANLIEENRKISGSQLTDDVERAINLKIEGFLDVISAPTSRSTRDTNELLLNEKSKLMEVFFALFQGNVEARASVEAENFLSHVRRLMNIEILEELTRVHHHVFTVIAIPR